MLKFSSDNRTIKETGFTGPSVFLSVNVRGPVYFAVSAPLFHSIHPSHELVYLKRSMVPTVSQSQPSAHILIQTAEGISALTSLVSLVGIVPHFMLLPHLTADHSLKLVNMLIIMAVLISLWIILKKVSNQNVLHSFYPWSPSGYIMILKCYNARNLTLTDEKLAAKVHSVEVSNEISNGDMQ